MHSGKRAMIESEVREYLDSISAGEKRDACFALITSDTEGINYVSDLSAIDLLDLLRRVAGEIEASYRIKR